jgi:bacterioferritin-associated ferredoxin
MYICLCNGYTDRQVRNAAPRCTTVADIYRTLGAPPRCGKCVPMVADLCRDAFPEGACPAGSDD